MKINWIMLMWKWLSEMVRVVYHSVTHRTSKNIKKMLGSKQILKDIGHSESIF